MLRRKRARQARANLRAGMARPPEYVRTNAAYQRKLAEQRDLILDAIADEALPLGERYRAAVEEMRKIGWKWNQITEELHFLEAALNVRWGITEFPLSDRDWNQTGLDDWDASPFPMVDELGRVIDFDPETGIAR
jgi:hypothetical protein